MRKPVHITDSEFEDKVLGAEVPIVVDFWAPWCGPCKMIAPVLDEVAEANDGRLLVAKVNTDENPEWAMHYGVMGIPTLLFMEKGRVLDRQSGAAPPHVIKAKSESLLKEAHIVHE